MYNEKIFAGLTDGQEIYEIKTLNAKHLDDANTEIEYLNEKAKDATSGEFWWFLVKSLNGNPITYAENIADAVGLETLEG